MAERFNEIISSCNACTSGYYKKESGFAKTWPETYREFLRYCESEIHPSLKELPFSQRLWHFLHGINQPTLNTECGRSTGFVGFRLGYKQFCSQNCECMTRHANIVRRETSRQKYGVDSPMQLEVNRRRVSETKKAASPEEKALIEERRKATMLDRFGVDNPNKSPEIVARRVESFKNNIDQWKESYKKTSQERYGADHPWSSHSVRDKYHQTMIDKYGADNPMKCDSFRNKAVETNMHKYGFRYLFQNEDVKERIRETLRLKYGVDNASQIREVRQKISDNVKLNREGKLIAKYPEIISCLGSDLEVKCDPDCPCGGVFVINRSLFRQRKSYKIPTCPIANPIKNIGASLEESVSTYLTKLGVSYKKNDRKVLGGMELDFFIPELNIGIEVNGVYWHGEKFRERQYHQQKTLAAQFAGVQLIHIWEDDWLYKEDIVKSMIAAKLGKCNTSIGARKCEIREVTASDAADFLTKSHLQGPVGSAVRLGLYQEGQLVSIATFGKSRKIMNQRGGNDSWELYRFANSLNTRVHGGFSKLLSHFIKAYAPAEILTFASADHSDGTLYVKTGFDLVSMTSPGYSWVIDGVRRHRSNFTKQKLVAAGSDPALTEFEIMSQKGYCRIWDSGNFKFKLVL
jgi:hypothetical protein